MHVDADEVVLEVLRGPGVQAHADAQDRPVGPGMRRQVPLALRCCRDGLGGVGEDDEEAVSLGAELSASVIVEGPSQDASMSR